MSVKIAGEIVAAPRSGNAGAPPDGRSSWHDHDPRRTRSKGMTNIRIAASVIAVAAGFILQGCYTAPTPVPVPSSRSIPERFEQSWQAARGAASDVGVRVTHEDRPTGTLRGDQGSSKVVDHGDNAGRRNDPGRILGDRRDIVPGLEPERASDARLSTPHGSLISDLTERLAGSTVACLDLRS